MPLKRLSFWGSYCLRPIWSSMVSVNLRGFSLDLSRTKVMPSRRVSEGSLLCAEGKEIEGQRGVDEQRNARRGSEQGRPLGLAWEKP